MLYGNIDSLLHRQNRLHRHLAPAASSVAFCLMAKAGQELGTDPTAQQLESGSSKNGSRTGEVFGLDTSSLWTLARAARSAAS